MPFSTTVLGVVVGVTGSSAKDVAAVATCREQTSALNKTVRPSSLDVKNALFSVVVFVLLVFCASEIASKCLKLL